MPYLGNELATQFQAFVTQTITGDGSTGYTLDRAVANGKELLVYINNVKQEEGSGKSYTASGTTITFSEAVASGDSCYVVFLGSAVQTVVPPDASIVSGMISNANLELPNTLDMNGNELILDVDGDTSITSDTDDQIDFKTGGSDRLVIDGSGRVGIDVTPTTQFGHSILQVGAQATLGANKTLSATGQTYLSHNLYFNTDGNLRVFNTSNANEGAILQVVDGTFQFSNSDATTGTPTVNERVRIDANGSLHVGRTSAGSTGNGHTIRGSDSAIFSRDASGETVQICRNNDNGELVKFKKNGSDVGAIASTIGIIVGTADTGLGFETSTGNTIIPQKVDSDLGGRDNAIDFGSSSFRFDDLHATNGTIQTSDQNEKQDIASATAKELNVAKKLSTLFKTFRWKDKVTEKGDKARTHTGIIAQEVQSAFSAEGLDASKYGLFISTTWTNEEGKEQTRLGVRYPELFSFIFSSIEARLTALESK